MSEYESAVLGCLLTEPNAYYQIDPAIRLTPKCFLDTFNQHTYEAIVAIADQGLDVELINVKRQMEKNPELANYKGQIGNRLVAIQDQSCFITSLNATARVLLESYQKKHLATTGYQLYTSSTDDSPLSVTQLAEISIEQITSLVPEPSTVSSAKEAVVRFKQEVEMRNDPNYVGYTTGFPTLDSFTKGFSQRGLTTIAAHTGVGKSFLALSIMLHLAKQGKKCHYISLEMSDIELLPRILMMLSKPNDRITYEMISTKIINSQIQEELDRLCQEFAELPISFDWGATSVKDIAFSYHRQRRTKGVDVLFVDHLHQIRPYNDLTTLCDATSSLKHLALKYATPVFLLSQFNRGSFQNPGKKPCRSWLKGSSSIEQDSDALLFLHREDPDLPQYSLILDKFRQSTSVKKPEINLRFDERTCVITERSQGQDNPYEQYLKPTKSYKKIEEKQQEIGF